MNNPVQFLDKITSFDGNNIDQHILDTCYKVINDPSQNYNAAAMLK